jgi:hypothetical protein
MNLLQNHYAQFYLTPDFLVERIEKYVSLGLTHEAGVIVIAAPEHVFMLQKKLRKNFDLENLADKGQLVMRDANEALALFMESGRPEPVRFEAAMGGIITEMSRKYSLVRAYGEMVNILWEQQNRQGTYELEAMWTALAQKHNFSLLCGYAMKNFASQDMTTDFSQVCNCHSHIYPDETYTAAAGDNDQYRRLIAELQQRNLALQNESVARKDLETQITNLKKQR